MSQKKRYHIHISLVRNENVNLENALEYALSTDYFLTWDLLATHTNFVEYSRQQIDQCDYMIFILDRKIKNTDELVKGNFWQLKNELKRKLNGKNKENSGKQVL